MFARSTTKPTVAAFDIDGRDSSKFGFDGSSKANAWWKARPSPKKVKIIIAVVTGIVVLAVAVAMIVMFVGKRNNDDGSVGGIIGENPGGIIAEPIVDIELTENDTALESGTKYGLPFSGAGELFMLFKNTAGGAVNHDTPAGRSYDGYAWEALFPVLPDFNCSESDKKCTFKFDEDDGNFTIRYIPVPDRTDEELVSDFLIHTTFGPTQKLIQSFPSGTDLRSRFKQFVVDQMNLPATSHREYYRLRTNTLMPNDTVSGEVRGPCTVNSRWERAAFSYFDASTTFTVDENRGLYFNGELRTEISPVFLGWLQRAGNGPYALCGINSQNAFPGGRINFRPTWSTNCNNNSWVIYNPEVNFNISQPSASRILHLDANLVALNPPVSGIALLASVSGSCTEQSTNNVYARTSAGIWFRFSPRMALVTNTLESPFNSSGITYPKGIYNPNVPKTFLNEKFCIPSSAATPPVEYVSANVRLNDTVLQRFYTLSGVYAYYITGLSVTAAPCSSTKARFAQKTNGTVCNSGSATAADLTYLRGLILTQSNNNSVPVVDLTIAAGSCSGSPAPGVELRLNSVCWQHVHIESYNVYDFSSWVSTHPGGSSKITAPALRVSANLQFPSSHLITQWSENYQSFPYLGVYGRTVDFLDLPGDVQKYGIALYVGAVKSTPSNSFTATELCGSPGEVANDPFKGNRYHSVWNPSMENYIDAYNHTFGRLIGKYTVWTNIALKADDQLRQRVAWALNQIFVITENDVEKSIEIETWINYYDIFVRNAFGNYFDILKEVTYSPMMGIMLSFRNSLSYQKTAESAIGKYPDENYAREIMQLFSIGLWKLNKNGTYVFDDKGNIAETYTNADIQSFARVWTGLRSRGLRGNFESPTGETTQNFIDPMDIEENDHDTFPKQGLDGFHIGDEYPLCRNLPSKMFLRKGAQYRYLGSSAATIIMRDPSSYELDFENSNLYDKLCNPDSKGACRLRSTVVLDQDLTCFGLECKLDVVRMVRVRVTATSFVNYEYVQPPCVELEFPEQGFVTVRPGRDRPVCVDARSIKAAAGCCTRSGTSSTQATVFRNYNGEQLTKASAQALCEANSNRTLCAFRSLLFESNVNRVWSDDRCSNRAQVFADGRVGVVLLTGTSNYVLTLPTNNLYGLALDSNIKLRVNWASGQFPTVANQCGGICQILTDSCLCNTTSSSSAVFTDKNTIPTVAQILDKLHVGAVDPSLYDAGTYTLFYQNAADGLFIYVDSTGQFNEKTIFEVRTAGSRVRYFLNLLPVVNIGTYQFRNPPNFMQHEERTFRDASYEIDAVLKHFLYHPNTATFVGNFMIKRLVSSNPSPAYLAAVADAFITGTYEGIGTGKYGDLAATIAAVLLYRDAVSPLLKADMSHGQVREPLIKVIHFMRSFELVSQLNREVDLRNLVAYIGQQPLNAPSVFNFYQSEFQPAGAVSDVQLYAPEAQVLTTPRMMGYLNSMIQFIEIGLTNCFSFSIGYSLNSIVSCSNMRSGAGNPRISNSAYLNYSNVVNGLPAESLVDKVDLLLTGGRLEPRRRNVLLTAFDHAVNRTNSTDEGVRCVLELFAVTPEFQVTSLAQSMNKDRPKFDNSARTYQESEYKAIVFIFLNGGADSHSLLVPHSQCGSFDLYQQYVNIRTDVAIPKGDLLPITVPSWSTQQPCSVFGVNKNMPNLVEMYNNSEALFIANIGTLVEPLTLEEFKKNLKRLPRGLYGHNTQQRIIRNLDASDFSAKGILGRIQDALTLQGKIVDSYSVSGTFSTALEGEPGISEPQAILDQSNGVSTFDQDGFAFNTTILRDYILNLTVDVSHSIMADTWNGIVKSGIERSANLRATINAANISANFAQYQNGFANQLGYVSRIIASREKLKASTNLFNVELGGFDTHGSFTAFGIQMGILDRALKEFVLEMKRQNIWDKITVVVASDFARTLGSNGAGTDHGWAGNTFIAGGAIKGGQILGQYPSNLAEGGNLNVGNGRLLPTTPWEALWNGVASWAGVDSSRMNTVLPNKPNFPTTQLFSQNQMYK